MRHITKRILFQHMLCVLGLQKYRRGYAKRVVWPDAVSCMNDLSSASLTHWASHCRIMDHIDLWWLRLCLLRQYEPLESARWLRRSESTFRPPVFEKPERPSTYPRIVRLAT